MPSAQAGSRRACGGRRTHRHGEWVDGVIYGLVREDPRALALEEGDAAVRARGPAGVRVGAVDDVEAAAVEALPLVAPKSRLTSLPERPTAIAV
jgi:hypothetical protein